MTRRQELREDKVVTLYSRFMEYFDENRNIVFGILGGIVLIVIMGFGYGFFKDQQENQAQEGLSRAVRLYEADNWREALDGNATTTGLLEVINKFGGTTAGNLAVYYAADSYLNLGEREDALKMFDRYNHNADALGAGAYAAEAAIYEDQGEYGKAADRYKDAARIFESDFTSARYLVSAGRNYERAGNFNEAIEMYESLREDFPDSEQAQDVDLFLARVNVHANK
ncbi:MAG: tetratricopeptide repeat protein [Rhodothermaceae bacterium]|nr:tetratricopeptide repeat protein [Rhodothermaceae bacterium]